MASSTGVAFLDHSAPLRDPRQSWKVIYPLSEVFLTVLSGTMAGAEDFVEIRRWAVLHMDVLRRFLPFAKGIPSHDTLNDIINAIDGDLFAACFTQWVASLGGVAPNSEAGPEVVAIDGKTSRRTHDRAHDRNPLHLVSAWASVQRLVLGQEACEAKSNEITAIPLLLDRLAIQGALVTIVLRQAQDEGHGMPEQDRPEDPRPESRLSPRREGQLPSACHPTVLRTAWLLANFAQPPRRDRARLRRS